MFATAEDGQQPLAGSFALDGRVGAWYELVGGLRAGVQYQYEAWRGLGADVSSVWSFQLHYVPGGLPTGDGR